MDKQLIFLGPLYPRSREEEIRHWQKHPASPAPNVFQWSLLDGLSSQVSRMSVVNVLPVGTWPQICSRAVLPDGQWTEGDISGREIGCLNLPFFKIPHNFILFIIIQFSVNRLYTCHFTKSQIHFLF